MYTGPAIARGNHIPCAFRLPVTAADYPTNRDSGDGSSTASGAPARENSRGTRAAPGLLCRRIHAWLKQRKTVRLQFVQDRHASNEQDQKFQ
jgi:hypothetical protein